MLSDMEYNDIKKAFGYDKGVPFTMQDLENTYLYSSNMRPQYIDTEYSLLGTIYTSNEGKRELTNYGSRVLAGLEGGFGPGEGDVTEYQDLGDDTYKVAKKRRFSNSNEYNKKDGILQNIKDIRVTKGMLMNRNSKGENIPLIKIRYNTSKGVEERIIPMSRLSNNIEEEFLPLIRQLEGTYRSTNPNNEATQKYIDQVIRGYIQEAFDKYKKR